MTLPEEQKNQKQQPVSRDAERAVLGGLILENGSWDHISDLLVESDFFVAEHRFIFQAISKLAQENKPFDTLTVNEMLKTLGHMAALGSEQYLFELVNQTPTSANVASYSEIVREKSILRKLLSAGQSITSMAFQPGEKKTEELIDDAERSILNISDQRASANEGPQAVQNILKKTTEKIDLMSQSEDAFVGLQTGFSDLDQLTSGLQPADLIIVAGRPSMGKTVLGVNIAENIAISEKKTVLIFSLEMPNDSIVMRMLSSLGRIDQHRVRTGNLNDDEWPRLSSAVNMITDANIFIDDQPGLSPMEMRTRARRIKRQHPDLGVIVVDYLQLMTVPGCKEGRTQEISEISRTLKLIAKELNVPVIALSQLNRGLEQRTDKRPVMSDLRESGSIEQDADLIAFIYRDEVYNENSPDKGTAEIIIAKHRNGPIGKVRLTFLGQFTRFDNFALQDVMLGHLDG